MSIEGREALEAVPAGTNRVEAARRKFDTVGIVNDARCRVKLWANGPIIGRHSMRCKYRQESDEKGAEDICKITDTRGVMAAHLEYRAIQSAT